MGSTSSNGSVSLYCGALPVLGCINFFTSKRKSLTKKLKVGAILIISLMIFYWQPLVALFCLLKPVGSYWYRYSYVTIFLLVFIAADYGSNLKPDENVAGAWLKNSCFFSAVLLAISWINPVWELENVYYTCAFVIGIAALAVLYKKQLHVKKRAAQIAALFLVCSVILELGSNTSLLMQTYSAANGSTYGDYAAATQAQVDQILDFDTETYRISQTSNYRTTGSSTSLTANYNEAMAYHYWSTTNYSSDSSAIQRVFLNALGYNNMLDAMNIVNTSILAADSLLGVKYMLSSFEINGLKKVKSIETANGKDVYYNPYALPLALVYDTDAYAADTEQSLNPFEYQNLLYNQLTGEDTDLYSAVSYESSDDGSVLTYTLALPEGNYAVYGNLMWSTYLDATLTVNDAYESGYAIKLSPTVFYIPTEEGDSSASVVLNYENWENPSNYDNAIKSEQFYILDLDKLAEVSEALTAQAADTISIQNGTAYFETTADEGDNLLVSIPYDSGWTITLNGKKIEAELFADCLYSIPLQEGVNTIEMNYHVPYMTVGVVITGLAIVAIGLLFMLRRKNK